MCEPEPELQVASLFLRPADSVVFFVVVFCFNFVKFLLSKCYTWQAEPKKFFSLFFHM